MKKHILRECKIMCMILSLVLIIVLSAQASAKTRHILKDSRSHNDFIGQVFNISSEQYNYLSRFNLTSEELDLVLYLYSSTGRPISDSELTFIANNKGNWAQITWYFGIPPIMFEEKPVVFGRPGHTRHFPPLGEDYFEKEYKNGPVYEKIEVKKSKHEYYYKNRFLGIEEKVETTKNKYSYHYKDKYCEEKIEVKYPSNKYEYLYKDKKTGKVIKYEGIGRSLNPEYFSQQFREEKPEMHLDFSLQINLHF